MILIVNWLLFTNEAAEGRRAAAWVQSACTRSLGGRPRSMEDSWRKAGEPAAAAAALKRKADAAAQIKTFQFNECTIHNPH